MIFAEQVKANYDIVHRHLGILEKEGVLELMRFGSRIRFYRFNQISPRAHAVQALLQVWDKTLSEY